MPLLQHFKQARAKPKEPFRRSAFTTVSALVQKHRLDESFLARLQEFSLPEPEWLLSFKPAAKPPGAPPPFSLVPEPQYRLTLAILAKADNPYLAFAHSPEELVLSGTLYRLNPHLKPAVLARVHFLTLLASECIRRELRNTAPDGNGTRERRTFLEDLLDRLTAFRHHQPEKPRD